MSLLELSEALQSISFSSVLAPIVISAIAVLLNTLSLKIIKPERDEKKAKEKLFNLLNKHLSKGGFIDLDFLKYLKSSIEREFQTSISISHVLEDFLVHSLQVIGEDNDKEKVFEKLKNLI